MTTIQKVPAAVGVFVLAVFSPRSGAHGASIELLRVLARVASRRALRRRLRDGFAGYLE